MPTYQYACTACGEQHEAVQSFTDAPLSDCPACGGRLRKVFSAVGVVFKGSGFYKTDSRSSKNGGGGKDGGQSGGDGAAAKTDGAASTSGSAANKDSAPAKSDSSPSSASTAATKTA